MYKYVFTCLESFSTLFPFVGTWSCHSSRIPLHLAAFVHGRNVGAMLVADVSRFVGNKCKWKWKDCVFSDIRTRPICFKHLRSQLCSRALCGYPESLTTSLSTSHAVFSVPCRTSSEFVSFISFYIRRFFFILRPWPMGTSGADTENLLHSASWPSRNFSAVQSWRRVEVELFSENRFQCSFAYKESA